MLKEKGFMENMSRVGLVLSGGGGKGAYQIGVLKALKENGYLDDITDISGASIGSVNAMLYAMDNIDIMYAAWNDIDMRTVFDLDLAKLKIDSLYFSREEMLKLVEKYIDFQKILGGRYNIYCSICKVLEKQNYEVFYKRLADYDIETIKKILLASTALPIVYETVEIEGAYYRDGGICDNEPIKPLYDSGVRQFIIIGLNHNKVFDASKWPDASFITIYPSKDLGSLIDGTLNFTERAIEFRQMLGYKDGLRAINTKFKKEDIYINLESALSENDYNEIKMQLRANTVYKSAEASINKNLDKFNEIAAKYDKY